MYNYVLNMQKDTVSEQSLRDCPFIIPKGGWRLEWRETIVPDAIRAVENGGSYFYDGKQEGVVNSNLFMVTLKEF